MVQKLTFPRKDDAQSINGIEVSEVPAPTDQDVMVYDGATGTIKWQAGAGESDLADRVSVAGFTTDVNGFYIYNVVFATPLPGGTNYQILLGGDDQRVWTAENITVNGFRIKTNSKTALGVGNYAYWRIKIV